MWQEAVRAGVPDAGLGAVSQREEGRAGGEPGTFGGWGGMVCVPWSGRAERLSSGSLLPQQGALSPALHCSPFPGVPHRPVPALGTISERSELLVTPAWGQELYLTC